MLNYKVGDILILTGGCDGVNLTNRKARIVAMGGIVSDYYGLVEFTDLQDDCNHYRGHPTSVDGVVYEYSYWIRSENIKGLDKRLDIELFSKLISGELAAE